MIIDFHTHTFPNSIAEKTIEKLKHASHSQPFSNGTLSGLLETQSRAGVDLSVIVPVATSPRQVARINETAYETNVQYDGKGVLSFAAMHPDLEDPAAELRRIVSLGMKGIKLHSTYQHVDADDIRNLRIYDKAAELGLVVMIHAGIDIGFPNDTYCAVSKIRHACDEIGDFKLIAAHMGGWKNWDEVVSLLADTSVYLDTAFSTGYIHPLDDAFYKPEDLKLLDSKQFMDMLQVFGSERILLGSDSPWSDIREGIEFIRELPISNEEKTAILGGNAEKLLDRH
ncbi:MAG: amidohydrolase family protein [Eubacteriales bacterium]|nr:amidohydrolase family protein [Eubacteriales bacterium]